MQKFLETFFNGAVAARYLPDILAGMAITIGLGLAVTVTGLTLGLALAILRSTGAVASNNSSSNEAKDFKVIVALDNPPATVRPGLSCTAKITVATRDNVVKVPIQALTVRQKGDLEDAAKEAAKGGKPVEKDNRGPIDLAQQEERRKELVGVFVITNGVADFREVETGITGATDIEITKGLEPGQEIMVGPYQTIRSLRPASKVTIDNRTGVELEQKG